MAWFVKPVLKKTDIVQVEQRLAEISQSQDDLNLVIHEIRNLTSNIVTTLCTDADVAAVAKVAPLLATISPLLQEVTPTIKALDTRFAMMCQEQHRIQTDITKILSLVSGLAAQMRPTA
jgi:hypothetical protein